MTKVKKRQLLWAAQCVALTRVVPLDWLRVFAAQLIAVFLTAAKRGQGAANSLESTVKALDTDKVMTSETYECAVGALNDCWERADARSAEALRRLAVLDTVWSLGQVKAGGDAVGGFAQAIKTFDGGEPFTSPAPNLANMAAK